VVYESVLSAPTDPAFDKYSIGSTPSPVRENALHTPIQVTGIDRTIIARYQPQIFVPSITNKRLQTDATSFGVLSHKTSTDAVSTISSFATFVRAFSRVYIRGFERDDDEP